MQFLVHTLSSLMASMGITPQNEQNHCSKSVFSMYRPLLYLSSHICQPTNSRGIKHWCYYSHLQYTSDERHHILVPRQRPVLFLIQHTVSSSPATLYNVRLSYQLVTFSFESPVMPKDHTVLIYDNLDQVPCMCMSVCCPSGVSYYWAALEKIMKTRKSLEENVKRQELGVNVQGDQNKTDN